MVNLGFVDFLCTKTGRWLQTIYQVGGVSELVGWIESAAAAATAVAAAAVAMAAVTRVNFATPDSTTRDGGEATRPPREQPKMTTR